MPPVKSAIQEVRDQLFLDRASGKYLSHVTSNLSFDRPSLGFHDDDVWRAVVRRTALDYRQIATLFYDLMTVIFGPRKTVATVLSANAIIGDEQLSLADWMTVPQRGTLVIDQGLAAAETVEYSFRDPRSGLTALKKALTKAHTYASGASGYLKLAHLAADTTLELETTDLFPVPGGGAKYTMVVAPGTADEEVVVLTANDKATDILTIDGPGLTKNQLGPTPTPTVAQLTEILGGGSVIKLSSTRKFPAEGLIRVQQDVALGVPVMTVRYVDNDTTNGLLTLAAPLSGAFTLPGVTVALMKPGALVKMAQVQVKGVGWDIFQTAPKVLKIFLPRSVNKNRIQDASFLHSALPVVTPSLAAWAGALLGDKVIYGNDGDAALATFPSSGVLVFEAGGPNEEHVSYTIPDQQGTTLYANAVTGVPIGSTSIYVNSAQVIKDLESLNSNKWIILSRNNAVRYERVQYQSINLATGLITLTAPTAKLHLAGDEVAPLWGGQAFYLATPLTKAHGGGTAVSLSQTAYAGTDLEDGRMFTASPRLFPGHYIYDPSVYARRTTETTLNENVAGPTYLEITQYPGRDALEVRDASLFSTSGTYDVRVWKAGDEETLDVTTVATKRAFNDLGVLTAGPGVGAGQISLQVNAITVWGNTDLGVRLLIDRGGANEEVVILQQTSAPNTIVLEEVTTKPHNAGETIEALADFIILSEALTVTHKGVIPWSQRKVLIPGSLLLPTKVSAVAEIRTIVEVVSAASFPAAGGEAILNNARGRIIAENRVSTAAAPGAAAVSLVDSTAFPTSGYPYMVEIGVGCTVLERLPVTNNAANTLTLGVVTAYAHIVGEWVRYAPGDQEQVTFTGRVTGGGERLLFDLGIVFDREHLKGESVSLSGYLSTPSRYGMDYPLYLPSSWEDRLQYLFDRGRAAGVQIVVIDDK